MPSIRRESWARFARAALALSALVLFCAPAAGQVLQEEKISNLAGSFGASLAEFDRFGIALGSLGDFDGDGVRDVVVGAHHDNGLGFDRGAVWLLRLSPEGMVRGQRKIGDQTGGFTGVLDDEDRFGIAAVGIGDLDQDGCIDLAVGAYRDDDAGLDAGAVWILFLKPDGSVREHHKINASSGPLAGRLGPNHLFGRSLAPLGDLDGDGALDLLVGASRAPGGGFQRGMAWILFLHPNGSVKQATAIGHRMGGFDGELKDDDRFGAALTCLGDLNGDGVRDIAIGAYRDDDGGLGVNADRGAVWVMHLLQDGSVAASQKISQSAGNLGLVLDDGDGFGIALCNPGDLNGDGIGDLVVGAEADDDGGPDRGAVYKLMLAADGTVLDTSKISSSVGGFDGALSDMDCFGVSIVVPGDLDGDGVRDLLVGASRDDDRFQNSGAVWELFLDGLPLMAPVADFRNSISMGRGPLAVAFSDESLGEIDAWAWDFGDGARSSHQAPVHLYRKQGSYTVQLTVSGPGGTHVLSKPNLIVVAWPKIVQKP